MSTTVTASQIEEVLGDYKIHLTGYDGSTEPSSTQETPRVVNPPNWPTDHRRVPDYRPIDRNRDAEGRPNGSILPERIFLTLMFTGVVLNASTAKLWGATAGPYFPGLFRYAIGGEW
ncbi:uncharacterized protein LY89DRAFT_631004 [Mollisia scopiformis]|uniref:Uncharacterized protein n=1 Tax=Mollisia scopiformis TaxID=149040 RepID=A0A132B4X1_MOLSC|nr:uncharacterized protein LY89DRAFT_631004 [Mollisia scopiformis]KUJ07455.1 hypothetical protein LY89DRAFT_631004 [Mollisia scopiformis]